MSIVSGPTQGVPLINDAALWQWDTTGPYPVVTGYPQGSGVFAPTKTGLTPTDLQNFVGVPLQYYGPVATAVPSGVIQQWIRYAEDTIEQQTSVLLCQTWVASPPAVTPQICEQVGIIPNTASGWQVRGYDYDLVDAAYDFMFKNAQDEAWMVQTLRYRPVQSAVPNSPGDLTAVKNIAYVYPLLNTYFRVPRTWYVEDHDFGLIRLVPSQNVQMLPLFAMQLAFMGFSENVPGAFCFQYTAGLTDFDYAGRWSFMKQLVLAEAAIQALSSIQGTINLGVKTLQVQIDGLMQRRDYDTAGPFAGLIKTFEKQRDNLLKQALTRVSGPMVTFL